MNRIEAVILANTQATETVQLLASAALRYGLVFAYWVVLFLSRSPNELTFERVLLWALPVACGFNFGGNRFHPILSIVLMFLCALIIASLGGRHLIQMRFGMGSFSFICATWIVYFLYLDFISQQ